MFIAKHCKTENNVCSSDGPAVNAGSRPCSADPGPSLQIVSHRAKAAARMEACVTYLRLGRDGLHREYVHTAGLLCRN